jgi:hypothetical protein
MERNRIKWNALEGKIGRENRSERNGSGRKGKEWFEMKQNEVALT